eukprot:COSAG02_NODE_876_length_16272_cov_138.802510_12_plen_86_part_00
MHPLGKRTKSAQFAPPTIRDTRDDELLARGDLDRESCLEKRNRIWQHHQTSDNYCRHVTHPGTLRCTRARGAFATVVWPYTCTLY